MTAKEKVIDKLNEKGAAGVSVWDFPAGFALAARIKDWRTHGLEIITKTEKNNSNTGTHARYVLIK